MAIDTIITTERPAELADQENPLVTGWAHAPERTCQKLEGTSADIDDARAIGLAIARRLRIALYDLRLLDFLGTDWFSGDGSGLQFGDLDLRRADHLVVAFEALACGSPVAPLADPAPSSSGPCYEQLTLF